MPLTRRDVYLGRGLGVWAFWLHRITGVLIIFYLLLHILVISTVLGSRANFDVTMRLLKSPIFVVLEMGLIAAILIHGLNGIRIILFDLGYGVKRQKQIFWVLMAIGVVPFLAAVAIAWPHIIG